VSPDGRATRAWTVAAGLVLVGVLVLGTTAVRFAPAGSSVAVWWPAAGLAAAFLLATGPDRRRAAVVVLGVVVASGVANWLGGRPPFTALCFGVANAAESLVVWVQMTRGGRRPPLAAFDDLFRLLVATVVGSLTFGVLAGLTVLTTLDRPFLPTAYAVTASHAAAVLVVAPLGMAGGRTRTRPRPLEALVQWTALLAVTVWVFGSDPGLPLAFLPLPFLVWGATRHQLRTVAIQLITVGVLAVVLTAQGAGPFATAGRLTGVRPETVGALTQAFLVTAAITALALAVATALRRQALEDLRREATFIETVLDSASATAIIGTDRDGVVTLFNRGAANLLGHRAEDVVGRLNWADWHDPAELTARAGELGIATGPAVLVHEVRGDTSSETRDWTWTTRDGRRIVVDHTISAIVDAHGAVTGYIGVAEDVTERREAAQAVRTALARERQAVEELTALDRTKTDFLSAVSHELRTPLASVLGYTEMLEDGAVGPMTERQLQMVGKIDRNGRRLLALIEDLLVNSRIEAGQLELSRRRTDLAEVVDSAWDSVSALSQRRDLTLRREVEDRPVWVDGDAAALERVVTNLLSNAVKFTPDGGAVDLRLAADHNAAGPGGAEGAARLVVEDTGVGIAEADLDQVFRRFFRATTATDHAVQGTGLGLSIVEAVVEAHGGSVAVASRPGEGATFTVLLPLDRS
jgi:PAS domain S-box-containing protein